jgi:hypothetical protein
MVEEEPKGEPLLKPFAVEIGDSDHYQSFEFWAFSLSAGLLAGEGLGGIFQALLAVFKVDGGHYGIAVGCPRDKFCG